MEEGSGRRKWKKVVTVFKICPCPLWHGPTHSPFSICFFDSFCILMKVLKICSVWIHIHNGFERIVEYLLTLSGKNILCIFYLDWIGTWVHMYVQVKWQYSKNIFFIILVRYGTYKNMYFTYAYWYIYFRYKSFKRKLHLDLVSTGTKVCNVFFICPEYVISE